MSDTFNDGDPIDAVALQKLKTEVARATALAGLKVSAGTNVTIGDLANKNPADIVAKQMFAGYVKSQTITTADGGTTFELDYSAAGFTKKPVIILTPTSDLKKESMYAPSIVKGTVTTTSATAQIRAVGTSKSVGLFFLAIQQ